MSPQRDKKWLTLRGMTGGLGMFAAEALVVAVLLAVAWLVSVVLLAIL